MPGLSRLRALLVTTAASGYTLTAQGGSYSLSGQSSALLRSKRIVASGGSYAVTGQQAVVERDKQLTALGGTYAVAGQQVTITYTPSAVGYTLTALGGSYTVAGQTAEVNRNRALTADSGIYTLSCGNAEITKSKLITALAGSYTLTGQSATIEFVGVETEPQRVFGGGVTAWQRHLWRKIEDEPQAEEIVKVIEAVAEQVITEPDTLSQQVAAAKQVRTTLENMGIAYKQAYQEIYLELLAEMQQEQEDAQIVAIMAALL